VTAVANLPEVTWKNMVYESKVDPRVEMLKRTFGAAIPVNEAETFHKVTSSIVE
jgi:hypothetical protein